MNDKQIEILQMLILSLQTVRLGDDRSFYKERRKIMERFNVLKCDDSEWSPIEDDFLNMLDKIRKIEA